MTILMDLMYGSLESDELDPKEYWVRSEAVIWCDW